MIADIRMDGISKINRIRSNRQINDVSFWSKNENSVVEKVSLKVVNQPFMSVGFFIVLSKIFHPRWDFNLFILFSAFFIFFVAKDPGRKKLFYPSNTGKVRFGFSNGFFVFKMHAVFGFLVHFLSADLYFNNTAVAGKYRSVNATVIVWCRKSHIIFNPSRKWAPDPVN